MKTSTLSLGAAALALALSGCGSEMGDAGDTALSEDATAAGGTSDTLQFGDNSSEYSNDGECDDARFEGAAMASVLNTDNIGKDAADCEAALAAGSVELNPYFAEPASTDEINYGDDEGTYPNDGDCDDIRFTGDYAPGLAFLPENIGHDATDCRAAVASGEARWQGATATPEYGLTLEEIEAEMN